MKKIFKFNQIDNFLKINKNKKIILCHGKFDFLHYGHIAHLKKAKKLGDLLIVSITMKGYSNDDSKIYFSDEVRAKHLLELDLVNCVLLVPFFNVVPVIKKIKPYYYCKGLEYNNYKNFSNKEIVNDIKIAKAVGSKVKFVGDQILSSSKIINSVFRKKETELSKKVIPDNFSLKYLEDLFVKMSKLKVMVIGDLIIDRYTFVKGNSLSSKNNILSSVKIKTENYFGGAASSYFHLKDFVKNLKFLSLINKKDFHHISKNFSNSKLFTNNNFKTIIKHKYVQDEGKNIELKKYFSVTDINEDFYSENLEKKILKYLKSEIFKYDLVMVLDFGHNFFTKRIIRFIERNSRSLSVNCQTNKIGRAHV
jgi:cytidyltransferase-like protein